MRVTEAQAHARMLSDTINNLIVEEASSQGMTITGLAGNAGLSVRTLSKHLKPDGSLTVQEYMEVCRILGLSAGALATEAERRLSDSNSGS